MAQFRKLLFKPVIDLIPSISKTTLEITQKKLNLVKNVLKLQKRPRLQPIARRSPLHPKWVNGL